MTTNKEVKEGYISTLADLTFNSKPLINVLTMLAEENTSHAADIVDAIETHLAKVRADIKLPVLYLIDCIIKNVGGTYTTLFCQNIVPTFCSVFEVVDEKTRGELFKLRQTWNDMLPKSKLYALDVKVSQMDPAWPVITPQPTTSIHLNPKFLHNTTIPKKSPPLSLPSQTMTAPIITNPLDADTLDMQKKLLIKQQQLLELQQKKLELELLQTQVRLQEKFKLSGTPITTATTVIDKITSKPQNILLKPEVAKQLATTIVATVPKVKSANSVSSIMNLRHQAATGNVVSSSATKIAPVNSALITATRRIRDPRLLRHQATPNTVNTNVQLENKANTSDTLGSNNKGFSNKMTVRDNRSEPRLVTSNNNNNKDNVPTQGKVKALPRPLSKNISKQPDPANKLSKSSRSSSKLSGSDGGSSKGSSSSLDSPTKAKTNNSTTKVGEGKASRSPSLSPIKQHKKKENRSDKKSEKSSKIPTKSEKDKSAKSDGSPTAFKELKGISKSRNYVRRNREHSESPELSQDVDLRLSGPLEKQIRIQGDPTEDKYTKSDISGQSMDVDLRQLPGLINNKKRPSTETMDSSQPKKSKSEVFDVLFGNEDTDLRQLPAVITSPKPQERPPTPPPPIISSKAASDIEEAEDVRINSIKNESQKSNNLDVLRAKLANATNRNKLLTKPRQELQKEIMKLKPVKEDAWRARGGRRGMGRGMRSGRQGLEPWIRPAIPGGGPWRPMVNTYVKPHSIALNPEVIDIDSSSLDAMDMIDQDSNSMGSLNSLQEIPEFTMNYSNHDNVKSINIDGIPRDIRYYDEVAIVFVNWDDPHEISFQNGNRNVIIDDSHVFLLSFNEPYTDVNINGSLHRIRLGGPTRELYVDGQWYECFFGGPGIPVKFSDGNVSIFKLEGPPPQVKIGDKRTDLVAGKINLIIDAKTVVPVFLDGKVQKFDVDGQVIDLRFIDALRTVLINNERFSVEFGGLPKPFNVRDKKHFIRFSVLPRGVRPGHVMVRDMEDTRSGDSPKNETEDSMEAYPIVDPNEPALPIFNKRRRLRDPDSPEHNSRSPVPPQNFNNLDLLSNVISSSFPLSLNQSVGGYEIENVHTSSEMSARNNQLQLQDVPAEPVTKTINSLPPALNINELFQKLVVTGIVTSVQETIQQTSAARPPVNKKEHSIKPVSFGKTETLKVRQPYLIQVLYAGMQCSSCGMRFPPEHSMYYSQHLDWHFRQNRKGKKNIRKAASRRWYYSLSDWKNYEEIEDLEEREKSYFENQQQAQTEGATEETEEEIEIPSVPADPNVQNATCEVCQDRFEQFYNEEKEEWHLRMAIRIDDKIYHPLCYEDYQASLVDPVADESLKDEKKDDVIPGLELDFDSTDKDNEMPAEIIIDDDEAEKLAEVNEKPEEEDAKPEDPEDDDDVIIHEVVHEKIDLVDDDCKDEEDNSTLDASDDNLVVVKEEPVDDGFIDVEDGVIKMKSVGEIKIKTEPVDTDYDEINENVDEAVPLLHVDEEEVKPVPTEVPHTEVVTFIDGNVEFDSSVTPASGIGGKIKINITKTLPVIPPKENKEVASDIVDKSVDYIDPSQPLPPGEEPIQLNLKPALQGIELKKLPPVSRGTELSGLCSIM